MNVKQLREILAKYPDDMPVMVHTAGVNGYAHFDMKIARRKAYTLELPTPRGWQYETIKCPILEITA